MTLTTEGKILRIAIFVLSLTVIRSVVIMISGTKIFKKAHMSEKMALIPFINLFNVLTIADISEYYGILLFIPFVNVIILVLMSYKLGTVFNTGILFKIGLVVMPLIFYLLLTTDKYKYKLSDEEYFRELDSAKDGNINLMTEDEIKKENEIVDDTLEEERQKEIDSIFKSEISMMDKVAPYKAAKIDLLGMEKLKDAPMDDDIFKPIEKINPEEKKDNDIEKLDL